MSILVRLRRWTKRISARLVTALASRLRRIPVEPAFDPGPVLNRLRFWVDTPRRLASTDGRGIEGA